MPSIIIIVMILYDMKVHANVIISSYAIFVFVGLGTVLCSLRMDKHLWECAVVFARDLWGPIIHNYELYTFDSIMRNHNIFRVIYRLKGTNTNVCIVYAQFMYEFHSQTDTYFAERVDYNILIGFYLLQLRFMVTLGQIILLIKYSLSAVNVIHNINQIVH